MVNPDISFLFRGSYVRCKTILQKIYVLIISDRRHPRACECMIKSTSSTINSRKFLSSFHFAVALTFAFKVIRGTWTTTSWKKSPGLFDKGNRALKARRTIPQRAVLQAVDQGPQYVIFSFWNLIMSKYNQIDF